MWIVAQVFDPIPPADIQHRSDRDEGAEAHQLTQAPVQNGRPQRAALADETDIARTSHGPREGGV
jgi:hypothetical protein